MTNRISLGNNSTLPGMSSHCDCDVPPAGRQWGSVCGRRLPVQDQPPSAAGGGELGNWLRHGQKARCLHQGVQISALDTHSYEGECLSIQHQTTILVIMCSDFSFKFYTFLCFSLSFPELSEFTRRSQIDPTMRLLLRMFLPFFFYLWVDFFLQTLGRSAGTFQQGDKRL